MPHFQRSISHLISTRNDLRKEKRNDAGRQISEYKELLVEYGHRGRYISSLPCKYIAIIFSYKLPRVTVVSVPSTVARAGTAEEKVEKDSDVALLFIFASVGEKLFR